MKQNGLSFSAVMQSLYSGLSRSVALNQQDFLHLLFKDFDEKYSGGSSFAERHTAHISKLMTGGDLPSRLVAEHYYDKRGDESFEKHLADKILPLLLDADITVGLIRNLVRFDVFLSESKREELLSGDVKNSHFLAAVIRYVLSAPSVRQRKADGIDLQSIFRLYQPPKPCKAFLGRESEIEALNTAIKTKEKVWVSSFPGMGKSEVVKAFAQKYASDYQDMIWIPCKESLRHSIASLILNVGNIGGTEDERFLVLDRLLRMLSAQSILFLDDVAWDVAEDVQLQIMLNEYACKIVIISRNADTMGEPIMIDVLQDETDRYELFKTFFPQADVHKSIVEEIMACVGYHTMAMEMTARLLGLGAAEPRELLERLKAKNLLEGTNDTFKLKKDQREKRDTYKGFIRHLFKLYDLNDHEKQILRCLALMPTEGIDIVLFKQILQETNVNTIHGLVDKGLILFADSRVSLQSLIRETVMIELIPTVDRCRDMISHLAYLMRIQWHNLFDHNLVRGIVENVIKYTDNDADAVFLGFLHAAYDYGDKHSLKDLKTNSLSELYREIMENGKGSAEDRVLIFLECANHVTEVEIQLKCLEDAYKLIKNGVEVSSEIQFSVLSQYGMLLAQSRDMTLAQKCLHDAIDLVQRGKIPSSENVVRTAIMCITMVADADDNWDGILALRTLHQYVAAIDTESVLLADIELAAASLCRNKKDFRVALEFTEAALARYRIIYGITPMETLETERIAKELRHICDLAVSE